MRYVIQKNRVFWLLLIFCCYTSAARADEETRNLVGGITAGIVGIALEHAATRENQVTQDEKIQWNNVSSSSRSVLQYDDRTAEIQLKLKKINLYDGKIDGLKGRGTIAAIESWEQFNSDAVDGEISDEEMSILDDQAIASSPNESEQVSDLSTTKSSGTNGQKETKSYKVVKVPGTGTITFIDSIRSKKDPLELLLYDAAAYNEQYEICKNLQDNYVAFQYRIDKNLEKNYAKYEEVTNRVAGNIANCRGLKTDDVEKLRSSANDEYDNSEESKMRRIRAGHVFTEPGEDTELVIRCNSTANTLLEEARKYNTLELDETVCR